MALDDIAKVVVEERKRRRLSQGELAKLAAVSRATLSGIENNSLPEVGARKLERLLNTLGYSLYPRALRRPTLDEMTDSDEP